MARFIKQRTRFDCGIAAAATALDISYQKTRKLWYSIRPDTACPTTRGIRLEEMEQLLQTSEAPWTSWVEKDFSQAPTLTRWKPKAPLNIILTWQGEGYCGHWISVCHGIAYDPHHDGPRLPQDTLRAPHSVIGGFFL